MRTAKRLNSGTLAVLALAFGLLALNASGAEAQVVRAFTARTNVNMNGDITLIGNTLMSCPGNGAACVAGKAGTGGSIDDNDFNMAYVDVDADGTTFCSSSANLSLPATATVVWAGLYWGGDSNNAARNQVKFSTPAAGYATLTASRLDATGTIYQGFIDVTSQVQNGGNGTYTTANVRSTAGSANHFAGWSLVVMYRDNTLPARNLVVFDGYASVAPGATVSFTVSGFVTPTAGPVNTRLGVVAGEGDLGLTGDSFLLNGTALADAQNPSTNFFNSSISLLGTRFTAKNPNYLNQLGWDADLVSANGILPNNATTATIALSSTNDQFYPGVVTFATDLYQPVIDGSSFTKSVVDLNGGNVQPGDVLEYTSTMTNTGQDNAIAMVLRDTLDSNLTYVAGSLSVATGANAGSKSDATGDDQMEYVAGSRSIVARLGTGANAASGGTLAPTATTSIKFRARVNAGVASGTVLSNQAQLTFNGQQLGTPFIERSDGNSNVAGNQPTTVVVTAATLSGTVFEDMNYGGGAGRSLATSAGVGRAGARVELYDSTGTFVTSTLTNASGVYSLSSWMGRVTVRVVNSTVTSSRPGALATLLPVETFRTDGTTGAAAPDVNRVGGEIPTRADAASNTTNLTLAALTTAAATPQSVTPVTVGITDIGGLDFGYNFDTIVNANDAGQGSLRQFLINSNALGNTGLAQSGQTAGTECSIFMVSDGVAHAGLRAGLASALTSGVVSIAVQSTLPAVTDASTRLDGATQTTNVGDTNTGTLGTGGTVGVDALALNAESRPEVELRDGAALALGLDLQAATPTVRALAIYGFGNATGSNTDADVRVGATATGALIERAVIGTSATSFADPGAAARSGGDHVRVVGAATGTLRDALVGFGAGNGLALTGGATGWQVSDVELRGNAIGNGTRSGVSIEASGTATLTGNLITAHEGAGVDARTATSAVTLTNNTITNSGLGVAAGTITAGVRLGGSGNRVDRCVLTDNVGAGVLVGSTSATDVLTHNSIWHNGVILGNGGGAPSNQIGIDLEAAADDVARGTSPFVTLNDNGDGDAGGNGLLNFPVLESAVLANGNFTITGWARPGAAIELFIADPDPSGFGEGRTYLTTLTEGSASDLDASSSSYSGLVNGVNQGTDNTNRFRFTVAAPGGVSAGVRLTATATLTNATSEFSGLVTVTTGVGVSGYAYADANHNLTRDAAEAGTGAALLREAGARERTRERAAGGERGSRERRIQLHVRERRHVHRADRRQLQRC